MFKINTKTNGTSPNWHFVHYFCAIENLSPPSVGTPEYNNIIYMNNELYFPKIPNLTENKEKIVPIRSTVL